MPASQTAAAHGEIESIIARTALKYDLLPYQSKPFAQSQPARLGAIARLFGLEAAPVATARVLELGCAAGGNIIPLAMRYPQAQFVGVDLSRTQVAAGRARIAGLGLKNIEIHCKSFTELGGETGLFDYIICHGVYSWVPAVVRDAILRISRERLSPAGVAYISYNVLPGWRMLQHLRDAFLLEVPDHHDTLAQVAQARRLLEFMKDHSPDQGAYGQMLKTWAERLKHLPDDYIAHEFLEETNEPCTVREFARAAQRHDLGFLGECDLASMILDNFKPETAAKVREMSRNDLVESEQYLDILTGRTFRQTLLVSAERMGKVVRALTPEGTDTLHFIGGADLRFERDGNGGGALSDGAGRKLTTQSSVVADGLERFTARFPASSSSDELAASLSAEARASGGREQVREAMYKLAIAGMVTLSSEPVPAANAPGERPVAIALARADALSGADLTTNIRHEAITIDAAAKVVLPLLDGTRDHAALAAALASEARAGRLNFNRDGKPVTDAAAIETLAQGHITTVLAGIARAGLLEA